VVFVLLNFAWALSDVIFCVLVFQFMFFKVLQLFGKLNFTGAWTLELVFFFFFFFFFFFLSLSLPFHPLLDLFPREEELVLLSMEQKELRSSNA